MKADRFFMDTAFVLALLNSKDPLKNEMELLKPFTTGVKMEALRKIARIKNNAIVLSELAKWENLEVEVIVLPLSNQQSKHSPPLKNVLFQFAGAGESQFTDSSLQVDELIYGK